MSAVKAWYALRALICATGILVGTVCAAGMACADPAGSSSWPLDNRHFDAERLWQTSTGRGVIVAVVDTGVDASRPDLARQVLPGTSLLGDGGDGRTDPSSESHGTAIAAIIAAAVPVGSAPGAVGLAPEASILPVRVSGDGVADLHLLAQGVTWAVDHGARIVNISMATDQPDQLLRQAIEYADRRGVVVVAAAGNEGKTGNPVQYPAGFPGVVSVSGIDENGAFWAPSESGSGIVLAAPASHVISADSHGSLQTISGTSYAAAYVSATAALLMEKYPQLSAHQVVRRLIDTASHHYAQPDPQFGYGLLDPQAALGSTAPLPADTTSPLLARTSTPGQQGARLPGWAVAGATLLATAAVTLAAVGALRRRRPSATATAAAGPTPRHTAPATGSRTAKSSTARPARTRRR